MHQIKWFIARYFTSELWVDIQKIIWTEIPLFFLEFAQMEFSIYNTKLFHAIQEVKYIRPR